MKDKINSFDYKGLNPGEMYSVSHSLSAGSFSVEISLSITYTGEKYQDIKILGGMDKSLIQGLLDKLSKELNNGSQNLQVGGSYTESISTIYNEKNDILTSPEDIRKTLTGISAIVNGAFLDKGGSVSMSPNGNFVLSRSGQSYSATVIGGAGGISVGSYLGR